MVLGQTETLGISDRLTATITDTEHRALVARVLHRVEFSNLLEWSEELTSHLTFEVNRVFVIVTKATARVVVLARL
ncbi:hypothetical protein D3C85_1630320 [compost metagenome]